MWQIPVFAAEREAGLETQIRASGSVAYAAVAQLIRDGSLTEYTKAQLSKLERARATNEGQFDLHYLKTLLVSTGWNLNEDVFDNKEVWAGRRTPEDKQFNYEHNCADIIGHITDTVTVDTDGKAIADDIVVDDLPDKFHVITNAVLYRYWPKEEDLQKRMDNIIAEIEDGKWYVSMEALFRGFDYAVIKDDKTMSVVARNEETAFLTKHLRAYGGTGAFNDMKVGRLMRNITFSGKGLVRKPANPESIIFSETEPFTAKATEIVMPEMESGYGKEATDSSEQKESPAMAETLEILQKQLADARAEVEQLKVSLRDNDVKQVTAAKDKVEADLKATKETLVKVEAEAKTKSEEVIKLNATVEEQGKQLVAANEELTKVKAEKRTQGRIAAAKEALGMSDEEAIAHVQLMDNLTEEAYAAGLDYMKKKLASYKDAGSQAATDAGSTGAKLPPKSTPADAPMAGKKDSIKTLTTPGLKEPPAGTNRNFPERNEMAKPYAGQAAADAAAEQAAASATETALENAETTNDPALAVADANNGVETVRASVSDYMAQYLGDKANKGRKASRK